MHAAQFCFFAHAPEELREPEVAAHVNLGEAEQHAKHEELHEPELAAHVKPGEPVLPAKHEPHRADDTASKIQVSRVQSLTCEKGRRRKGSVGQKKISIFVTVSSGKTRVRSAVRAPLKDAMRCDRLKS